MPELLRQPYQYNMSAKNRHQSLQAGRQPGCRGARYEGRESRDREIPRQADGGDTGELWDATFDKADGRLIGKDA